MHYLYDEKKLFLLIAFKNLSSIEKIFTFCSSMSSLFPQNHIPNFKQQNANYIALGGGVCFPFTKNYGNHVRKTF